MTCAKCAHPESELCLIKNGELRLCAECRSLMSEEILAMARTQANNEIRQLTKEKEISPTQEYHRIRTAKELAKVILSRKRVRNPNDRE